MRRRRWSNSKTSRRTDASDTARRRGTARALHDDARPPCQLVRGREAPDDHPGRCARCSGRATAWNVTRLGLPSARAGLDPGTRPTVRDQVLHGSATRGLAGPGRRRDPCADVDGDTPELVPDDLILHPCGCRCGGLLRSRHGPEHGASARDGRRGGVRMRKPSPAVSVLAPRSGEARLALGRCVYLEEIGPLPVAEHASPSGRTHDDGEHVSRDDAQVGSAPPRRP